MPARRSGRRSSRCRCSRPEASRRYLRLPHGPGRCCSRPAGARPPASPGWRRRGTPRGSPAPPAACAATRAAGRRSRPDRGCRHGPNRTSRPGCRHRRHGHRRRGLTPLRADRRSAQGHEQATALAVPVDVEGQQFLASAGLAPDQQRLMPRRQGVGPLAQLTRTRVDEHQRLGQDSSTGRLTRKEKGSGRLPGPAPPRKLRRAGVAAARCGSAGDRDVRSPAPSGDARISR